MDKTTCVFFVLIMKLYIDHLCIYWLANYNNFRFTYNTIEDIYICDKQRVVFLLKIKV